MHVMEIGCRGEKAFNRFIQVSLYEVHNKSVDVLGEFCDGVVTMIMGVDR